ncbi:MAG TPA: arsenosugar biosynthesis radical SAM (seleno)protein ArsS [Candidatus Saccharimonadales bacterium]|nr:arsenosugar biosynthesis radical SAM (seleno)protein ArsS [Candidatus Saccharimonadales bacterium]
MAVLIRTLRARSSPLASSAEQVKVLESRPALPRFDETLSGRGIGELRATGITVLQINLGKLCNQTCRHCHVDAGPDRGEVMSRETVDECLSVLERTDIPAVDITGGAPELNPSFRHLVAGASRLRRKVMDRCNLSVLNLPSQAGLAEFLAHHRVEIVASLPCYTKEMTDAQRGEGVFLKSIEALRRLNGLGYGRPGSGLVLDLVANAVGPRLPSPQRALEETFRARLADGYGIVFNRLYTMTNMPIGRFLEDLLESGRYEEYMQRLVAAFNPAAAEGVMCRYTLSVGWDGRLYDCDFNQMLEIGVNGGAPAHISGFDPDRLDRRGIATGNHCYGCTAGAGSSCGGAVV